MIFVPFMYLIAAVVATFGTILQSAGALFPGFITGVSQAFAYFLQPIYYFKGILPVNDILDFIGNMLLVLYVLGLWNVIMYFYSKVPIVGKK